jgi:KUP system potassium uptake protein
MSNSKKGSLASLMVGAIGVVYGDIGTSPLYALKSCFLIGKLPVSEINVLGLISIFIWSLFLIVTVKYINVVMRVDKQGEGGILVLSTIAEKLTFVKPTLVPMFLGIVGAALIFGDGVITPAISVLGALEGLELISPVLSGYILPLAFVVLSVLFYIQKSGSGLIGLYFGPIMIVWFVVLGVLGVASIMERPDILMAFNPYYAVLFMIHNGVVALMTLGGTILVVTGAEALYADMGHFGKRSITLSWTFFVFPALLLNYLGQGALLLGSPEALSNPFYHLVPDVALYPMIILSTVATIIASQSILSGVFSLAWQGIMLNYLPRLTVVHTSSRQIGQVYVPAISFILYILTITAVLTFRTSDNLAVAYGLSVSGCMLITTFLVFLIASHKWHWSKFSLVALFTPLILIDTTFVMTNIIKIVEGAWYTVLITAFSSYAIFIWIKGNKVLEDQKTVPHRSLRSFLVETQAENTIRIPGTAVFMTRLPNKVPNSLLIHLHHNKFLHKKLLFVSIVTLNVPKSNGENKYSYKKLAHNAYMVEANFGFMEVPSLRKVMNYCKEQKIIKEHEEISYFLSKGVPVASNKDVLSGFGENLFILMSRNSLSAYEFYNIPNHRVIELGVRYRV